MPALSRKTHVYIKKRSNVLKSALFYTSKKRIHIYIYILYPLSINAKRFGCISISPIYRCNIFTKKYILANFSWMKTTLRGNRYRLVFCDKIQGFMQGVPFVKNFIKSATIDRNIYLVKN